MEGVVRERERERERECEREREREGGRENKERLATRNCIQWRTNGTTPPLPFPGPCFFVRFPGQLPRLQRGGPCAKECKEAHLLGRRGNKKKQACGSPKREAKKKMKKVRDQTSQNVLFFDFPFFFFSHACSSSPLRLRVLRKEGPTARPQAYFLIVCEITEQRKIGLFRALFSRIMQSEFIGFYFLPSLWPR